MGAWGFGTFENDDAGDWLFDLEETNDLSLIEETLLLEDDDIEAPEGSNALAAAEVVAALSGKVREDFSEEITEWIEKKQKLFSPQLKEKALEAIKKVLSKNSELRELWSESSDFKNWKNDVNELKKLLE